MEEIRLMGLVSLSVWMFTRAAQIITPIQRLVILHAQTYE